MEEGWTGDGVSLQAYLHSWCVVWACLSSLLGLMTKILLSHFLIGLKLFNVKSLRLGFESGLLQRVKGPTLLNRRPKIISCQKVDDLSDFRPLLTWNNFRPIKKWLNRIFAINPKSRTYNPHRVVKKRLTPSPVSLFLHGCNCMHVKHTKDTEDATV